MTVNLDVSFLIIVGLLLANLLTDFWRVWVFKRYLQETKKLIEIMDYKNKELREIAIKIERFYEVVE